MEINATSREVGFVTKRVVGRSEALHPPIACTADPGTPALLPTPAFPGVAQLARLLGLNPIWYPIPGVLPSRETGTSILICSLHNPQPCAHRGRRHPGDALVDVGERAQPAPRRRDPRRPDPTRTPEAARRARCIAADRNRFIDAVSGALNLRLRLVAAREPGARICSCRRWRAGTHQVHCAPHTSSACPGRYSAAPLTPSGSASPGRPTSLTEP
jgi:hypothetical protein